MGAILGNQCTVALEQNSSNDGMKKIRNISHRNLPMQHTAHDEHQGQNTYLHHIKDKMRKFYFSLTFYVFLLMLLKLENRPVKSILELESQYTKC